jgi:hypothetical protein
LSEYYFSEREAGPPARIVEEIGASVWGWITVYISGLADNGSFGGAFPDLCPDNDGVVFGTNENTLSLCLAAEIPGVAWPLAPETIPPTLTVLDFIEFCHRHVAKPAKGYYHPYWNHYHLSFDVDVGQAEYRQQINRILARNGLAFELQENGQIARLIPSPVQAELQSAEFRTGDEHLDRMLETARQKYLSPDPTLRRESLEKLWDAWERLKSLDDQRDKKKSAKLMLDRVSVGPQFRSRLEAEAHELTGIGNEMMIRHTEVDKEPIQSSEHVDYLFQRMFAIVFLVLRTRGQPAEELPF